MQLLFGTNDCSVDDELLDVVGEFYLPLERQVGERLEDEVDLFVRRR